MSGPIGTGSFNGLSWGPATKFHVSALSGWDDLPPVVSADQQKAGDEGAFAGLDYLGPRTVTVDLTMLGDTPVDYDSLVLAAQNALTKLPTELPLKMFSSTRQIKARVRRRTIPYDAGNRWKTGVATVQFVATDPRIYDPTLTTLTTGLAAVSGGMTFNATFPLTFGTVGGGGTVVATNAGNFQTPLTLTIAGPVTNPIIDNQATGQSLVFLIALGASDTLVISGAGTSACSILLNGTASRRNALAVGSAPLAQFGLPGGVAGPCTPGTSQTLRFRNNAAFAAGTLSVAFSSAWI